MIGNQNLMMQYLQQMQNRTANPQMTKGSMPGISGLLGGASGGLLGLLGGQFGGQQQNNTQNMMRQYLQGLSQRRYNPPAIPQQPGMVSSQMGPGGMQYRSPQVQQTQLPQQQVASPMTDPTMRDWWQRNVGQYMPDGGSQQAFNQWGGGA